MTIGVTSISFPSGKTALEQIEVGVTTDAAFTVGSVVLESSTVLVAAAIVIDGLGGTAYFPAGSVWEGSYTVTVLVASATDQGKGAGGPLVVVALDPQLHVPYTLFIEAVRDTIRNSALLPELDDDSVVIREQAELNRDSFMPAGVVIDRAGPTFSPWETTAFKEWTFSLTVLITTKPEYDGEWNDEERREVESLSHRVYMALEANQNLGGVVDKPLNLEPYDPAASGRVLSGIQFWESLTVHGSILLPVC